MEPFLPWPGSKAKCAKEIYGMFPASFNTYFEPFLGSGAVFFAMNKWREFKEARLSDNNAKLINCWQAVKDRPDHVAKMLTHCLDRNSEEYYRQMRSEMGNPSVFLYVMRAAFSSMYRENLKGQFNVPWRKQDFQVNGKKISFNVDHLGVCSRYMHEKKAKLSVANWFDAVQDAREGDLVYLDPPYLPFTENGFVTYIAGGFAEGHHVFMRTQAELMAKRGVFVVMSNSDVPATRRLYGDPAKIINVVNAVKATATEKGTRAEGLWIWRPGKGNN